MLNTSASIAGLFYAFKTVLVSWGLGFLVSAFSFSTADNDFRSLNEGEALVVRVQTESPAVIAYEEAIRLEDQKIGDETKEEKENNTDIYDVVGNSINTNDKISLESLRSHSFNEIQISSGIVISAGKIKEEGKKEDQASTDIVVVGYNGAIKKIAASQVSKEIHDRTVADNKAKKSFKSSGGLEAGEAAQSLLAQKPILLSGLVEFDYGLTLRAKQKIIVYTSYAGHLTDLGRVNSQQGTFDITLTKGLNGFLVAELQDEFGGVVAEAEALLSSKGLKENLKLRLKKVSQGLTVAVNDFADIGSAAHKLDPKHLYIENENISRRLHLSSDGRYKDNDILAGSDATVSVRYPGYRPTLSPVTAGIKTKIEIFSHRHADAIEKAIDARSSGGLIFGQVTKGGAPVEGAEVIFADEEIKATYFLSDRNISKLIYDADKKAKVTGAQGYYAAGNIGYPYTAVRVKYQSKIYNAEIVPVRPGHITYFNFELGLQRNAKIEVKSFLTNQILESSVDVYGLGESVVSQDIDKLPLAYRPGQVLFDVDPGAPYAKFMQSFKQNEKSFTLFALEEGFFLSLAEQNKIKILPNTGIVFGTASSSADVVSLAGENKEIIYFDRSGKILPYLGADGGGFLVYNLQEGQNIITATCETQVFTKQILIEARKLHGVHVSCSHND